MSNPSRFVYSGHKTREISFPLGGIGTGSIGLAGNGRLIDWEIFNKPNKGSLNGFSHFSVKAERDGLVVDARVLHADLQPPYSGSINGPKYNSFGFGPNRENLAGLPHFRTLEFRGEFPIATLTFCDDDFPGRVALTAFNPFIPLNEFDSGIPAAFFEFEISNNTAEPLTYTLAGALSNPLAANNLHSIKTEESRVYLHLTGAESPNTGPGDLTLVVEGGDDLFAQAYWFRGAWFDNLEVYWREFCLPGGLKSRTYLPEKAGESNTGMVAVRFRLQAGEARKVRFLIAWNFPVFDNYWNTTTNIIAAEKGIPTHWKNYYAIQFEDSLSSARYALENWERLYTETRIFHDALYTSDLDPAVLDAVTANLAVMKSPTVTRLEDGTFYGFEGCHPDSGCCEGSCTHVWNYQQAVSFLFPVLERSMRAIDFNLNQRPDGAMRFRLPLPAGLEATDYWVFHPCADGQFGNILKAYGDWKISGDTAWLRQFWPAIKQAIEFAWAPTNEYRWDPEKKGVLTGRMHHTLDMELFGPDAWLNGFYLAALKAGAEMAEVLGDLPAASEYRAIFAKGKAWVDKNLFNGEYYHQIVNLKDRALIESFSQGPAMLAGSGSMVGSIMDSYWNAEHSEMKYQIGEGCEIDQLLAQYHANTYGLGEIFDPVQARIALQSLYKYNFKKSMRAFYNPCRIFALDDEAGLVMCEWPTGCYKPMIPLPYAQEVMTGFEYAAATLMVQFGLVEQGLEVVSAVRNRYDGEKRNPWNEIECGSNYARALSGYALLTAFSGFEFDLPRKKIGFNPVARPGFDPASGFQSFWSIGTGWGVYHQTAKKIELDVLYGTLELQGLRLPFLKAGEVQSVTQGGMAVTFKQQDGGLAFARLVKLWKENPLVIKRK